MNERRIHQVFVVSLLLKAAHAVIECVGGVALYLIPPATIAGLVNLWTQDELLEDPNDLVANRLLAWTQGFSLETEHFYALYLLVHGVTKVLLVAGLLRGKLWAYPASLVVMGIFVFYQIYRFTLTHGLGLIALTLFDLVVIWLIWHEWRVVRRHRPVAADT